jgi:hypothetical protein
MGKRVRGARRWFTVSDHPDPDEWQAWSAKVRAETAAAEAARTSEMCPTCHGAGELSREELATKTTEAKSLGLDIRSSEIARLRAQIDRLTIARDGWHKIGAALMATAIGAPLGGFSINAPPIDLLEGLDSGGSDFVARMRDAMLGRAWRVRGSQGEGTCDYPLCPNRDRTHLAGRPFAKVEIGTVGTQARLNVCNGSDRECHAWALWVQQRAATGRIEIRS